MSPVRSAASPASHRLATTLAVALLLTTAAELVALALFAESARRAPGRSCAGPCSTGATFTDRSQVVRRTVARMGDRPRVAGRLRTS